MDRKLKSGHTFSGRLACAAYLGFLSLGLSDEIEQFNGRVCLGSVGLSSQFYSGNGAVSNKAVGNCKSP